MLPLVSLVAFTVFAFSFCRLKSSSDRVLAGSKLTFFSVNSCSDSSPKPCSSAASVLVLSGRLECLLTKVSKSDCLILRCCPICLTCGEQKPNRYKPDNCPKCGAYLKYVEAPAKATVIKLHKAGLSVSYASAEVYSYNSYAVHTV